MPLNETDWEWYTSESKELGDTYPIAEMSILPGQFSTWALESYGLALSIGYPEFTDPVPDAYKQRALPILQERMMLAATRLARTISDIYGQGKDLEIPFLDIAFL